MCKTMYKPHVNAASVGVNLCASDLINQQLQSCRTQHMMHTSYACHIPQGHVAEAQQWQTPASAP